MFPYTEKLFPTSSFFIVAMSPSHVGLVPGTDSFTWHACTDSVRHGTFISKIRLVGTAGTCQGCQMRDKVSHSVSACVQVQLTQDDRNPDHILLRCVAPPTTSLGIRNKMLKKFSSSHQCPAEEKFKKKYLGRWV